MTYDWAASDLKCVSCGEIIATAAEAVDCVFSTRAHFAAMTGGYHWTNEKADDIALEFATFMIDKHLREQHRFSRARAIWVMQTVRVYFHAIFDRP